MSAMSFMDAERMFQDKWEEARKRSDVLDPTTWALYYTWNEAEKRLLGTAKKLVDKSRKLESSVYVLPPETSSMTYVQLVELSDESIERISRGVVDEIKKLILEAHD